MLAIPDTARGIQATTSPPPAPAAKPPSTWTACPLDPATGRPTERSGAGLVVMIAVIVLALVGLVTRLVLVTQQTEGPIAPVVGVALGLGVPALGAYVYLHRVCRSWYGLVAFLILGAVAGVVLELIVQQRPPIGTHRDRRTQAGETSSETLARTAETRAPPPPDFWTGGRSTDRSQGININIDTLRLNV